MSSSSTTWAAPVSYTHLDVYKRQGLHIPSTTEPYAVSVVLDHAVTHVVEAPDLVADQAAGLRAHATQVTVFDGYYTLSNNIAARLSGREGFAERGVVTDELIGCGKPWQAGLFD